MAFDIKKYLGDNDIKLGTVTRNVGDAPYKGGHNDIRKTNYEVKLTKDGKLDLYTSKKVIVEGKEKVKSLLN